IRQLEYVREPTRQRAIRTEAMDAKSTWARPSVVDRVDGRYRGAVQRDVELPKKLAGNFFIDQLSDREVEVRLSAAKAIGKLNITEAASPLGTVQSRDPHAPVRIECLKALVALNVPQQEQAIKSALADRDKSVRVAGLDLLERMSIPKPVMIDLLNDVIPKRTTEEKQAAIVTLGKLTLEHGQQTFDTLLDRLEKGQLNKELLLELGEAIDSTGSDALKNRFATIRRDLSPDELLASYATSLQGGDVSRGRRVFFQHQQAQCMKCHAYDDRGGNAGPRLNGVANRLSREQLLEALIDPGRRIAPGFGMVVLELTDGRTVSGIYQGEDQR